MKFKYALDNVIDTVDAACNWYIFVYLILCIITVIDQRVIPFGTFKTWVNVGAVIALTGIIFIPDREQRKEMKEKKNKKKIDKRLNKLDPK